MEAAPNIKDYGYRDLDHSFDHNYILDNLIPMLNIERNRCILDLGCGNGALTAELLSKTYNIYGSDVSPSGVNLAASKYPGRFALQPPSGDDIPSEFEAFPFDTVISTEVIEHVFSPEDFILLCKKTLLKNGGGELILSTPYHGYLKNLAIAVLGKWDSHANPLWEGGHIKLWSKNTLTELLEKNGFTVTDFIGCGRIPYFWKSMLIKARI